jgi:DNA polymerase elongation subunit (family B)
MKKLKTLVFDLETSPLVLFAWDLRDQNFSISNIQQDWHVMAWAAKWLDDPASKVIYRDLRNAKNTNDDKEILGDLWKLLDEADIVITQNGQKFDSPKINARFIMHGMKPPSPYRHLDTYQIVKKVAKFTSNKLEYLTAKLCTKYKKLSHGKFPGLSLWINCLKGNVAAWNEMRRYNIQDVLSTEELYTKIRAWAPESMPDVYIEVDVECRTCGSSSMHKRGVAVKKKDRYQRWQCQDCGTWTTGQKIKEEKEAA